MFKRLWLGTLFGRTGNESQADCPVGIGVNDSINDSLIHDLQSELLTAFADQCLFWRFAGLDLPAHELPFAALGFMGGALADKTTPILADNRPDDLYNVRIAVHFPFFRNYGTIPEKGNATPSRVNGGSRVLPIGLFRP